MKVRLRCRGVVVGTVFCLSAAAGAFRPAIAAEPVAHRAEYALSLGRGDPGGTLLQADGALSAEIARGCDGTTETQRTLWMRATYADGSTRTQQSALALREDARSLTFETLRVADASRAKVDVFVGAAAIGPSTGRVNVYAPSSTLSILPDTLFPMRLVETLLAMGEAGVASRTLYVFDGTSVLGYERVVAQVRQSEPGRWAVELRHFVPYTNAPPTHVTLYQLRDNGVIEHMSWDWGAYRVDASLRALELGPDACSADGAGRIIPVGFERRPSVFERAERAFLAGITPAP